MLSKGMDFDLIVAGNGISAAPLIWQVSHDCPDAKILVVDRAVFIRPEKISYPTPDQLGNNTNLLTGSGTQGSVDIVSGSGQEPLKKWWVPDVSGGGSVLWYGQMSRFTQHDLTVGTSVSGRDGFEEVRDWPISIEDLEAYYCDAEKELTPFGSSYGHDPVVFRGVECQTFVERPVISSFEKSVIDFFHQAGIGAYVGQTCLGGRTWDTSPLNPMAPEVDLANEAPLLHRPNWLKKIAELVVSNSNITVLDNARVNNLRINGGVVAGINAIINNKGVVSQQACFAPAVVLGVGVFETVRILLESNIPNRNGLVGKRVTFTQEKISYLKTPIPRASDEDARLGRFGSVTVKDYCLPRKNTPVRGGKISVYDAHEAEVPTKLRSNLGISDKAFKELYAGNVPTLLLKLSYKGESLPHSGRYIGVGSKVDVQGCKVPRLVNSPHPEDFAIGEFGMRAFEEIAEAIPGSELIIPPQRTGVAGISAHQHGGAVFGSDPSDSVISPDCENHELDNLFVVDGSFMPTSGSTNSSLTLMANSLRIANVVSERMHTRQRGFTIGI